jgi:hypothetical protein
VLVVTDEEFSGTVTCRLTHRATGAAEAESEVTVVLMTVSAAAVKNPRRRDRRGGVAGVA